MLYSSAGHGLKIWKKDLTSHSTTGPAKLGMGSMLRGGLAYKYFVVGCPAYSQIYGCLILAVLHVLGHHSFA